MNSSLFTRIEKLESRRGTDGQVLLIWLRPNEDVDAAVLAANKAGLFGSGDLVMCVEWLAQAAQRWAAAGGKSAYVPALAHGDTGTGEYDGFDGLGPPVNA